MRDVYFIAEIGVNHEAKINSAFQHIREAKQGGLMLLSFKYIKQKKLFQNMQNPTGINL